MSYKNVPLEIIVLASPSSFDADAKALLDMLRNGLGLALNNALAHNRLQRLAALDPLTGVYNRRFGLGRLREEFGRAVRANGPLGVLMIDIDHFKVINDTYGHLVGDRVLSSTASVVRSVLREGDLLIRYGGEEFLAVLPVASTEDLQVIGERLRRAVEESTFCEAERRVWLTVSVGCAACPNHDVENEEKLVELADQAMYWAKQHGRNRVESAAGKTVSSVGWI